MSKTTISFDNARRTQVVELPSFEGSKVTIYKGGVSVQDERAMKRELDYKSAKGDEEKTNELHSSYLVKMITKSIKEWNFDVEVSEEVVGKIPQGDLKHLTEAILDKKIGTPEEEKKN